MSLRVRAFFFHVLISLVIAAIVVALVFWVWYPAPLHQALGVTTIFLLLLLVDVTLGPLLTFLVFKPGKKSLALDLTVIACLQLSALGYGMWTVAEGRPLWLVFNVDRFDLVQAVDVDDRRLSEALPEYRREGWLGPEWVGAVRPVEHSLSQQILFESLVGGSDIAQRPELYRQLGYFALELRAKGLPLEQLKEYNDPAEVAETLAHWPQAGSWLPLMARVRPMVVLLGTGSEVLGVVPLTPW